MRLICVYRHDIAADRQYATAYTRCPTVTYTQRYIHMQCQ